MSESSRTFLDLGKTCRTCLTQKSTQELRPLTENNLKSSINETINEVFNIQMVYTYTRKSDRRSWNEVGMVRAIEPIRKKEMEWARLIINSSLPSSICNHCLKYLNIALHFRSQVQSAETHLTSLISEDEPDHVTAIYKSYTVLNTGVIEEIIGPQDQIKDNLVIVESVDPEIQDIKHIGESKTVEHYESLYAIKEEITPDDTGSINYFVTNDGENSNSVISESENVNLTKSTIVLNATLTNVIKWADSENNVAPLNNNICESKIKLENFQETEECIREDNENFESKTQEAETETRNASDEISAARSLKIVNFGCDLCSKTFRFEFIFKKHLLKHGIQFNCELCGLPFNDTIAYLNHVKKVHRNFKPFGCPDCAQRFFTLTPLKMHYNSCHIEDRPKRFECDLCGKTFTRHHSLTVHKKKHTNSESYKCDVCHKKLAGSHSLRNHLKIHKGEKKHKCDICGATFIHRFSLRTHLRIHTGEKPFVCKLCGSKFTTSSYLKIHMRTHTSEKPYVCLLCPKSFVSRCSLAAHEKAHTGEKKYQCDICGWRSTRSADLRTHIRKHTGEKPYKCDQCEKSYKSASNLATHRRTHLGLKEHLCNICSKAFGDPRTLKSHIRIHTGEMPYQCHVCGHRFKQSGQLSAHRRIHPNRDILDHT